jgi:hypothetical protein
MSPRREKPVFFMISLFASCSLCISRFFKIGTHASLSSQTKSARGQLTVVDGDDVVVLVDADGEKCVPIPQLSVGHPLVLARLGRIPVVEILVAQDSVDGQPRSDPFIYATKATPTQGSLNSTIHYIIVGVKTDLQGINRTRHRSASPSGI